ncbi:DUF1150 family protein [Arenibaculum pallidiluteum]|uniref:DUF1150 family protein n=1 Tax=Arenibaculum pallidiluteum TaxID=2812559 RepID=UPI001A961FED|nr:DUF1150 family protein [Arenibaculum pallidiluteum]
MQTTPEFLRRLSTKDFASFGLDDLAYVKRVETDEGEGFAIHAADGTPLAVVPERDVAFATVRQNDLEPVSVH